MLYLNEEGISELLQKRGAMQTQQSLSEVSEKTLNRSSVYVVDSDSQFLIEMESKQYNWNIQLMTESDPAKAKEKLSEADFNPSIVIVSDQFLVSKIRGYDLIEVIKNKKIGLSTVFGLLLETEDLKTRIEALRQGISLIFRKPISIELLLKGIKDTLDFKYARGIKCLLIDEDEHSRMLTSQSLTRIGVEMRSLPDSKNLMQTLENFLPQVLLISASESSNEETIDILKVLPLDARYQNIYIIMSLNTRDISIVQAYSAITDGILYQPLDEKTLQAKIIHISKRYISSQGNLERDEMTGLPSKNSLQEYLYQLLVHADKEKSGRILALIEVDDGNKNTQGLDGDFPEQTLVRFSNLILRDLNRHGFCACLEGSRFAFISESTHLNGVRDLLENFLRTAKREMSINGTENSLIFNCGITSIPAHFMQVSSVLKHAEDALESNKRKQNGQLITLTTDLIEGEEAPREQKIALVETDKELTEILSSVLKARGFAVHTYTSGKSFENDFFSDHSAPPALVITERLLPDMDGLELLRNLNGKYPAKIPLIFLTSLSSEKDIFEGIKAGAVDYIVKPFNLKILVQKSLMILS